MSPATPNKSFDRAGIAKTAVKETSNGNMSLRKTLKSIVPSNTIVEYKGKRWFCFAGLLLKVAFQLLFSRCFDQ